MELPENTVHVWRKNLSEYEDSQDLFFSSLSPSEQLKAVRFNKKSKALEYILTRGFLRQILSLYTKKDAKELIIGTHPGGKPYLKDEPNICFNLSHSRGYAAFGFAKNRKIGIDVEYLDLAYPRSEIAQEYFSSEEKKAYLKTPASFQPQFFFSTWVRKEAFIKATGLGLSQKLESFSVISSSNTIFYLEQDWRIQNLDLHEGTHRGALVAEGCNWTLNYQT